MLKAGTNLDKYTEKELELLKGISTKTIANAYYCRSKRRTRIKDMGPALSIVGVKGHTVNNGKNTNHLHKPSNIWYKIKAWVWQYFS